MKKLRQAGFTLIEVLIISPVVMLTIIIIMSFLFNQYGQLTQQGSQINLNIEAQNITFSMQDDIFYANAFNSGLNSGLLDTYQPSGGWKYNSDPKTLIISTPALTESYRSDTRKLVYINTEGCDASVIQENAPLYNNVIYFVSGTNMYKRIVSAPATMATCGTSFLPQSCPSDHTSASCPADRLLTDKLNSFTITYYDNANNVTTTPEQATKIKIDLQLKDKAYAEDIFTTNSITLKRLNQ
jgi:type II secretory pathway pseudopilin PulG